MNALARIEEDLAELYVEDIVRLLTDDDQEIRRLALVRFDEIPLERRIIKMISYLEYRDSMTRFFAESYLMEQGKDGISIISQQLNSGMPTSSKIRLVYLLSKIDHDDALEVIAAQLNGTNEPVMASAINALSRRGAAQYQALVRHCFGRNLCRWECIRFLANFISDENTLLFRDILDGPDLDLQLEAARALARMRDFSALPQLIFKSTDPAGPHKSDILMAISDIITTNPQENFVLPQQLRESFLELLDSNEPGALLAAVKALARFTDKTVLEELTGKIGKSSIADEIIYQILTSHGLSSIPIIIRKLTDKAIPVAHGLQFLLSMVADSSTTQLNRDEMALIRTAGDYILTQFATLDPNSKLNTMQTFTGYDLPGAIEIVQLAMDDDIVPVRPPVARVTNPGSTVDDN